MMVIMTAYISKANSYCRTNASTSRAYQCEFYSFYVKFNVGIQLAERIIVGCCSVFVLSDRQQPSFARVYNYAYNWEAI